MSFDSGSMRRYFGGIFAMIILGVDVFAYTALGIAVNQFGVDLGNISTNVTPTQQGSINTMISNNWYIFQIFFVIIAISAIVYLILWSYDFFRQEARF